MAVIDQAGESPRDNRMAGSHGRYSRGTAIVWTSPNFAVCQCFKVLSCNTMPFALLIAVGNVHIRQVSVCLLSALKTYTGPLISISSVHTRQFCCESIKKKEQSASFFVFLIGSQQKCAWTNATAFKMHPNNIQVKRELKKKLHLIAGLKTQPNSSVNRPCSNFMMSLKCVSTFAIRSNKTCLYCII